MMIQIAEKGLVPRNHLEAASPLQQSTRSSAAPSQKPKTYSSVSQQQPITSIMKTPSSSKHISSATAASRDAPVDKSDKPDYLFCGKLF